MRHKEPSDVLFDTSAYSSSTTPPAGAEDPELYTRGMGWAGAAKGQRAQDERLACVIRAFEAGTPNMLKWLRGIIRESDKADRERERIKCEKRDSKALARTGGPGGTGRLRNGRRGKGGANRAPTGDGEEGSAGPDVLRPVCDTGVPRGGPPVATVAGAPTVSGPEEGGFTEAQRRDETANCPECGTTLDPFGRCLKCMDWMCRCGRMTHSFFISECPPCTRAQELREAVRAEALREWHQKRTKR